VSSLDRSLSGDVLRFHLADETRAMNAHTAESRERTARTLVKNSALRVTLINVEAGGEIREHQADGPITVHVLNGELQFKTAAQSYDLKAGELLALDGGIRHSVASASGATFLLTIVSSGNRAS
jgi:quercetin dioxygenase-like cupin family protein